MREMLSKRNGSNPWSLNWCYNDIRNRPYKHAALQIFKKILLLGLSRPSTQHKSKQNFRPSILKVEIDCKKFLNRGKYQKLGASSKFKENLIAKKLHLAKNHIELLLSWKENVLRIHNHGRYNSS